MMHGLYLCQSWRLCTHVVLCQGLCEAARMPFPALAVDWDAEVAGVLPSISPTASSFYFDADETLWSVSHCWLLMQEHQESQEN